MLSKGKHRHAILISSQSKLEGCFFHVSVPQGNQEGLCCVIPGHTSLVCIELLLATYL